MSAPNVVLELVERFGRNRDTYRQPGYKEAQLRQEFIDPFFEALGWDMSNKQGYAEAYKDVIHEDSLKIGPETKAPDYCLRVGGTRKFFIEAKKPAVNVKMESDAAYQLKRYAWSAKLPLGILTNFDVFAAYDCTKKPAQLEHPSNARLLLVSYVDYASRWAEIADVFSRDAVLKGLFDSFAGAVKAKRGTTEVDSAFLAEIDSWRAALARNLNLRNPRLAADTLNWAVQQTIDRIVFLRICEDRGIEPYGQLRTAVAGKEAYASLGQRFQQADDKFNSGLFHFRQEKGREPPDATTLGLAVDDGVLRSVVADLYYPESPYEFSVLPPDILGQVYEQFLGKTIVVEGGRARVELRPEVAKAGGVYYTPTHIVDRINATTLAPLLADSDVQALWAGKSALRVVDPACGSGGFLLDAYQKLLDWYIAAYVLEIPRWSKGPAATIREDGRGGWRLTTTERKRILLAHVYGVDLDPQAVEVTKLSLLLKVLEGETQETLAQQLALFHQRALPDLGDNIKCGNSLVGPDFIEGFSKGLSAQAKARVNAFDWSAEFPAIFADGGFDALVMNPPWLMAGYYVKPALAYFQSRYTTATGKYDMYYLFIERALRLCSETGRIGMIVPNKMFHTVAAIALREAVAGSQRLEEIVDFGDAKLFARATNYSCLLLLGPPATPARSITYARSDARLNARELFTVDPSDLGRLPWTFTGSAKGAIFGRMRSVSRPLRDLVAHFGNGAQTGADTIYLLDAATAAGLRLEPAGLAPFLRGRDVRRYAVARGRTSVVFPYRSVNNRFVPVDESELAGWPNVEAYLTGHRKRLSSRQWFGKTATELSGAWYGLMYLDHPKAFRSRHLLTPSLANRSSFAIDEGSLFATGTAGVVSVVPRDDISESIEYLLAVLNSTLLTYFAVAHSPIFQGGYYKFSKAYIDDLPIRRIDPNVPADIAIHDRLRALAIERMRIEADVDAATTPHDKLMRVRRASETEAAIDGLVFSLYGLGSEEAEVIRATERDRLAGTAKSSQVSTS
jgi:hypothetical protein